MKSAGNPSKPFLELRGVDVWRGDEGQVLALRGISVDLREGESVAVLGPNGSGKSTLLKLITGEVRAAHHPDAFCRLFGEDLWNLEELRHRIGVVMPEEVGRFHPHQAAMETVLSSFRGAYGVVRGMRFRASERDAAMRVLEKLGIGSLAAREYGALSSGEKRRFLIARALVHGPDVLVLDEASTALDFAAAATLMRSLRDLLAAGTTLVQVTHHPAEIPPEIDRVILLSSGEIVADGPKRRVLNAAALSRVFGTRLQVSWHRGWCQVQAR